MDELTRPLGLPSERRSRRLPLLALAAPPLAMAIGLAVWFAIGAFDDRAAVVATIAPVADEETGSVSAPPPAGDAEERTGAGLTEVLPTGGLEEVGGEVVITDPSRPAPIRLAAAPREELIETGDYGLLPRIADDGTRPLDAYARPGSPAVAGARRVAIVIGGIGIEDDAGRAAIAMLPGEVTLGLVPYGEDLSATVAAARAGGHEILLQVPMEPYNYPDLDPGPQTLTVEAGRDENLDRLRWLLGQATTYVGVMNYMGARFTSDEAALSPVIGEIAGRGLLYVDDGSSARSRSAAFAAESAPVLQADLVLDADTTPAAIDGRLDRLVAIAAERGYAVATGSAFPTTLDRVAAFAAAAERRGIVLVPVSALAGARS